MSKWILPSNEEYKKELFGWVDETEEESKVDAFSMILTTAKRKAEADLTDALDMLEEVASDWGVSDEVTEKINTFLNKFRSLK